MMDRRETQIIPACTTSERATMIFNDDCKIVNDPGRDERLAMSALPTA